MPTIIPNELSEKIYEKLLEIRDIVCEDKEIGVDDD